MKGAKTLRQEEAQKRKLLREKRSPEEQLKLIESRRGSSKKEKERLLKLINK
tara:strand:- start:649 stop:804 length:156 start_codon:yes stop_codon:yes gene_type:complete